MSQQEHTAGQQDKRKCENDTKNEREQKRIKLQEEISLHNLSEDELSLILEYLCTGEIMLFACASKPLFDSITNIVKAKQPLTMDTWSCTTFSQIHRLWMLQQNNVSRDSQTRQIYQSMSNWCFEKLFPLQVTTCIVERRNW
jgi:hypothetical protein